MERAPANGTLIQELGEFFSGSWLGKEVTNAQCELDSQIVSGGRSLGGLGFVDGLRNRERIRAGHGKPRRCHSGALRA